MSLLSVAVGDARLGALRDTVSMRRERTVRCREREKITQQLMTDSVGNMSSQFVLLIGGLAQFAHFSVCFFFSPFLFNNMCNFLAAEDSVDAFWLEQKVFAYGLCKLEFHFLQ